MKKNIFIPESKGEWEYVKIIDGEKYIGKNINGTIVYNKEHAFKTKWFKGGK